MGDLANYRHISHDQDGNLTDGPLPDGPWGAARASANAIGHIDWDARNRLTRLSKQNSEEISQFGYSPDQNLESIDRNGEVKRLIVDPYGNRHSQVLARILPSEKRVFYVHVPGAGLLYEESGEGELRFYHFDHIGSTIGLTDMDGKVVGRAEYSPYGEIKNGEGELLVPKTPFLYNGRVGVYTDSGTGLLQMRARFYSPQLRRFLNAAGRPIGLDRATGQTSSTVTIITAPNGNLVTMFPGVP